MLVIVRELFYLLILHEDRIYKTIYIFRNSMPIYSTIQFARDKLSYAMGKQWNVNNMYVQMKVLYIYFSQKGML